MSPADHPRAGDDGFSLVEVVIALAILMILTTGVYRALSTSTKTVTSLQTMVEEQGKARNVLASLQSELRNAFSGTTNVAQIVSMSGTGIQFTAADRGTPLSLRRLTYTLTSGVLTRSIVTSTNTYTDASTTWNWPAGTPAAKTVLSGIQNATVFVYKDATGAATTDPALVRTVEITLVVRDPSAKTTQQAETYATTIRLRGAG